MPFDHAAYIQEIKSSQRLIVPSNKKGLKHHKEKFCHYETSLHFKTLQLNSNTIRIEMPPKKIGCQWSFTVNLFYTIISIKCHLRRGIENHHEMFAFLKFFSPTHLCGAQLIIFKQNQIFVHWRLVSVSTMYFFFPTSLKPNSGRDCAT